MDTSQLLLVSSLGLAVNLFGMFAMGGHHHHVRAKTIKLTVRRTNTLEQGGHSHSHGHSHGHSHDHREHTHSPVPTPQSLTHSHPHSHSHSSLPESSHSHTSDHSHSHSPEHSHSSGHSHSHVADCDDMHSHSHSHSVDHSSPDHEHFEKKMKRAFSGAALQINLPDGNSLGDDVATPLTPSYSFGHDDHFKTHHNSGRTPNLHDHSHAPHSHEGHSHNMRGVFLHVMAVCSLITHSPTFLMTKLGYFGIRWSHTFYPSHPILRLDGI